jgi:hypothetical protein
VTEFRFLRWRDDPGVAKWIAGKHKRGRRVTVREGDVTVGVEVGVIDSWAGPQAKG